MCVRVSYALPGVAVGVRQVAGPALRGRSSPDSSLCFLSRSVKCSPDKSLSAVQSLLFVHCLSWRRLKPTSGSLEQLTRLAMTPACHPAVPASQATLSCLAQPRLLSTADHTRDTHRHTQYHRLHRNVDNMGAFM